MKFLTVLVVVINILVSIPFTILWFFFGFFIALFAVGVCRQDVNGPIVSRTQKVSSVFWKTLLYPATSSMESVGWTQEHIAESKRLIRQRNPDSKIAKFHDWAEKADKSNKK